jgi:hypothetical protein
MEKQIDYARPTLRLFFSKSNFAQGHVMMDTLLFARNDK